MNDAGRATRGGVGAVVIGATLAALALLGGWASGAIYEGWQGAARCAGPCVGAVLAEGAGGNSIELPDADATPASTDPPGFPYVSARSIAMLEGGCGALIYGRDEHLRLRPASLTKLMTAAVAVEQADDLGMLITSNVDGAALNYETGSSVMGLTPGMQLSLLDLLYGLLLPSGNDAAIAIAEGISGSEEAFAELMNAKAASLALDDSHFTNPHGLDDEDLYSSAQDMAILARYVMQNEQLREIVRAPVWQPAWDGPPVWNGNAFLEQYDGADGVKIGYTEQSFQTIVASAERDGRRIIAALMRSQDRYTDAARLLDWGFEQPSACP